MQAGRAIYLFGFFFLKSANDSPELWLLADVYPFLYRK
jgi:hypothetical protein